MPNIFKAFSRAKAEPYQFPDAAELVVEDLPAPEEPAPPPEESPPPLLVVEIGEGVEAPGSESEPEAEGQESRSSFA